MNIVKFETDFFFIGKHNVEDLSKLLEEVPDNSQIFFVCGTGADLFVKKDNVLHETTMEDWKEFYTKAWDVIGPTRKQARKKHFNELPDSYFTKIIHRYAKK